MLLQCKLTGKAQEVCTSLSLEDSLNYDMVKAAIFRTYELVPEAYRHLDYMRYAHYSNSLFRKYSIYIIYIYIYIIYVIFITFCYAIEK